VTRVLLCYQPTDGGVGRHVRDVASGLSERGYAVSLCGPSLPGPLDGGAVASDGVELPDGVAHVRLDLSREIAVHHDLAALGRLVKIIDDLRPDIIHAHSSKAGALARLARLAHPRTTVLYTPHGYSFAGHFTRAAERQVYRAVERGLAPLASRVVCVCEAEARLARAVGPSDRVRVVHNGIAPAHDGAPDPYIADLASGGPVIGTIARLRPGKGLETLIDAAPHVLARHPDAKIAIVGDGPHLGALRAQATALGVAHAVHFTGACTDPLAALRSMRIFALPSWAEAFPYVVLEAMSLGRPIVASDVGGIGEALSADESGVIVPARDSGALGGALVALLDDEERAHGLGQAALERVSSLFSLEAMIDGLASVYDEIVTSSPRQADGSRPQLARMNGRCTP
jgi:glycosyltransferase involved in cell wall biosynthesis